VAGPGPLSLDRVFAPRAAKLSRADNLADFVSRETPERSAI